MSISERSEILGGRDWSAIDVRTADRRDVTMMMWCWSTHSTQQCTDVCALDVIGRKEARQAIQNRRPPAAASFNSSGKMIDGGSSIVLDKSNYDIMVVSEKRVEA